ncbi:MAG: type 1 glutamine amidotransferase [bacterium]|nr:type 1 glutamine amidotransferase [bacterium]
MPRLLVFQHVAHEILGTLDPLLRSHGFRNRYVNFGRDPDATPNLDGYHGVIVLGGPMNVDESDEHPHLETEVRLLAEAMDRDLPVLGICLGAQLLAKALGAEVSPNHQKEIGWYEVTPTDEAEDDPLFSHFTPAERLFQWHGDTFDIPRGGVRLATAPTCENQAFRYGDRAYGLQFHLEVDTPLIERWLGVPHHREEIEAEDGRICPDRIRRDTETHASRLEELGERVFTDFIGLFGELRRRGEGPHS